MKSKEYTTRLALSETYEEAEKVWYQFFKELMNNIDTDSRPHPLAYDYTKFPEEYADRARTIAKYIQKRHGLSFQELTIWPQGKYDEKLAAWYEGEWK